MTKQEMLTLLKQMGLKKEYKPTWDKESNTMDLECRGRGPYFGQGKLLRPMIFFCQDSFNVLTPHTKKAEMVSHTHKQVVIRVLNGEAELIIPVSVADELLHYLGAKVKSKRRGNPEALKKYRGT